MLFESQGWAKSTSKNVAKGYVDVQITANHYTLYYANNKLLEVTIARKVLHHPQRMAACSIC
jgi:hypothetical protein